MLENKLGDDGLGADHGTRLNGDSKKQLLGVDQGAPTVRKMYHCMAIVPMTGPKKSQDTHTLIEMSPRKETGK